MPCATSLAGGAVTRNVVALTTVTCFAAADPKWTTAPGRKPVPEIVIWVPPVTGPEAGAIRTTRGGGSGRSDVARLGSAIEPWPAGVASPLVVSAGADWPAGTDARSASRREAAGVEVDDAGGRPTRATSGCAPTKRLVPAGLCPAVATIAAARTMT